ncbi:M20 peptidase aminoacylase family protein [Viridibacillus sp. YIM B01967]|uniref:M20 peptidase aminoacylase family protein n=1 Tax=Viridibacillus soli TaxID=2798301 RepID=A0ABS1H575_9BACL|nr:M20 peptidase aminoacylase family protein [Viridibacillus soli]MBK3494570.1 M20 peptidase aminoacylase family protein [Viridibacillus soli]
MKEQLLMLEPQLHRIFKYLHENPEVSWKERRTTEYIKGILEQEGYEVHTFVDSTGLYVEIGEGRPVVGLRTDIDALWQEVDGEFCAHHSCGHDAHMTMVIGVLLLLKRLKNTGIGTIRVLFQPAEEKGQGALSFVDRGLVDDMDYLFGVHVRPVQELSDGTFCPALYHGASMLINGQINGEESHAARPHLGKNAIEIGASLIEALKTIHIDTMIPFSVKVTKFQAGGESGNIIPAKAFFSIDVRAQTNEGMEQLHDGIERTVRAIESLYDIKIDLHEQIRVAAAEVNEGAKEIIEQAIIESVGEDYLRPPIITPGGEDFHFYTVKRENVKASMLGLGCGLTPGLHHPKMTFNEAQLIVGVEILARTVLGAFAHAKNEALSC